MARNKLVKIVRDGNVACLYLRGCEEVLQILREKLTYTKRRFLRGKEARQRRRSVEFQTVACYSVRENSELPPAAFFSAGFLYTLVPALRRQGYRVSVVAVHNPGTHPQAYTPLWSRLSDVTWRYRQEQCVRLMASKHRGRIWCPTAYGKSFMIRQMARLFGYARMVITTPSVDVLEMIHEELSKSMPLVGLICGRRKLIGDRVNCISTKSLLNCKEPVDFVFADEMHELGTDDNLTKLVIPPLRRARMFGFSANMNDRLDGADFELNGLFGPIIFSLSYQEAAQHGAVAPLVVLWRAVHWRRDPIANLTDPTAKERHAIWRFAPRNKIIATDARYFADRDIQALITVNTLEHALFLKRLLPDFTLCYSGDGVDEKKLERWEDVGLWPKSEPVMTPERRRKLKQAFAQGRLRKAIATSIWKRGVDFTNLPVLLRADGASTAIADTQIPGRVSRLKLECGKRFGFVIDYTDDHSNWTSGRAEQRAKHYAQKGWKQINLAGADFAAELDKVFQQHGQEIKAT
jgi:superfamily II DNA or RNA helicase